MSGPHDPRDRAPLRRPHAPATDVLVLLLVVLLLAVAAQTIGPAATRVAFAQDLPAAPTAPDALFRTFLPMVQGSADGAPQQPPVDPPAEPPVPPPGEGPVPVAGTVIPGQFIVVLQPAALRAAGSPDGVAVSAAVFAQQTIDTYGGQLLYTYENALPGFAAQLPDTALQALAQDPNVALVEPDQVVAVDVTQTSATWGLDRVDQRTLPLNSSYIYNVNGAGVHVYIVDTGVLGTHTEFSGRMGNGFTAITDGKGTVDCNGHGTHVAGTVAGTVYGLAKRATVHPVRVLACNGSGTNSGVIAGVDWVTANHVKPAVANMSLGGGASTALDTAVNNSINAGVTFAVAAGNSNAVACNYSPARVANALTVGATTNTDARSSFSNYGSCVDLFAPGSAITSAWYTGAGATAVLNGTSMASPHVAGAAALYLQTNPGASPATVRQALVGNATTGRITNAGTGSPNTLLFTGFIGAPVVNPTATPVAPVATATRTPVPPTAVPTATPVATATPRPVASPTATPVPVACIERVVNPGFESGRTAWSESSAKGYALICSGSSCGVLPAAPRTGTWLSWLGGGNSESAELRQTITLPAGQSATLTYQYWVNSTDYCGYDYAYSRLIDGTSTVQLRRYSLCTTGNTGGWRKDTINLSAYAGKTVTLAFRATTDSSYVSDFFVDDLSLQTGNNCVAATGDVEAASAPFDVPEGAQPGKPVEPDLRSER